MNNLDLLTRAFDPTATASEANELFTQIGSSVTSDELIQLLDERTPLYRRLGSTYLQSLDTNDMYEAAESLIQRNRTKSGNFLELVFAGYLRQHGLSVEHQPKSANKKRADLLVDNRIVIDTTTTNRERAATKIKYLEGYPNRQIHIVTGDTKPLSKADYVKLFNNNIHVVMRDSIYAKIGHVSPLLHSFTGYIADIT